MIREIPRSLIGDCLCGAATTRGRALCLKCRNRARWFRRKALHDGI